MKETTRIVGVLALMFILLTSCQFAQNNEIFGTWTIVSGSHSGNSAPQYMMNRFQSFNKDNTFESTIVISEEKKVRANWGIFHLINDTTVITYHKDESGSIDKVANTYNFKIRNDSLHFYGFYLRQISVNPPALVKVYIDEWWVKTKK